MTKEETRREVLALWDQWPDRGRFEDREREALIFFGWLRSEHSHRFRSWRFGPGDPYQHVKGWIIHHR